MASHNVSGMCTIHKIVMADGCETAAVADGAGHPLFDFVVFYLHFAIIRVVNEYALALNIQLESSPVIKDECLFLSGDFLDEDDLVLSEDLLQLLALQYHIFHHTLQLADLPTSILVLVIAHHQSLFINYHPVPILLVLYYCSFRS